MKESTSKKLYIWTFLLYLWLLIWVIALKFNSKYVIADSHVYATWTLQERLGKSWIPFYSIGVEFRWDGIKQPLMNFIIYMPMGYYVRHYTKSIAKTIAIVASSSIIFELLQLFTGLGSCDTTDVIINSLGGIVGMLLYSVKARPKLENGFNIVSLCIYAPIAVYALVNTSLCWHLYKGLLY
jgi:glycopeptide antibiotics resistance protein